MSSSSWIDPPAPIFEKNGSEQPFRFIISPYIGGSDHSYFVESASHVPALSLSTWPDLAYHTDRDRPDRCDPTQLKRTAFIGAVTALAACSGSDEVLEALIRLTAAAKCSDLRTALVDAQAFAARAVSTDGEQLRNRARNEVVRGGEVAAAGLASLREVIAGKSRLSRYLDLMLKNIQDLIAISLKELDGVLGGLTEIRAAMTATPQTEDAEPNQAPSGTIKMPVVTPGKDYSDRKGLEMI